MLKPARNPRRSRRGNGVKRLGALVGLCLMLGAVAFTALRPPLAAAAEADWIDGRTIDDYLERVEQASPDVDEPFIADPIPPPDPVAVKNRRSQIDDAAARLRLQSLLPGRHPLAMVNGHIYRVGKVIEVVPPGYGILVRFQVVSISEDSVTLLVEEPEHDLRVENTLTLRRQVR